MPTNDDNNEEEYGLPEKIVDLLNWDLTPYQAVKKVGTKNVNIDGQQVRVARTGTLFGSLGLCIFIIICLGILAGVNFWFIPDRMEKAAMADNKGLYTYATQSEPATVNFSSSLSTPPTSIQPFLTDANTNFTYDLTKNVLIVKKDDKTLTVSSGNQSAIFMWDGAQLTETVYPSGNLIFAVNREEAISLTVDDKTIVVAWLSGKGLFVWIL